MNRYPDALYLDRVRLMKLRSAAKPLSNEARLHLQHLLDYVIHIINPTVLLASQPTNTTANDQSTNGSSSGHFSESFMDDWPMLASKIGLEMAFQDEDSIPEAKTWDILEKYKEIPLKAMAVLSLIAFASMYGKAQLVASSSGKLATSIASLKQQPPVRDSDTAYRHWSVALGKLLDRTVEVADQVLAMEDSLPTPGGGNDPKYVNELLLPSAVHKIINVICACWKLVVDIMIKRSRTEMHTSLVKFDNYKWNLENKLREFKSEVSDEPAPVRSVPKGESQASLSCWWKLRQQLIPTYVKSKGQTKLLSGTQGAMRTKTLS